MGRFLAQIAASFLGMLLFVFFVLFLFIPLLVVAFAPSGGSQPAGESLVLTLDLRQSRPDKIIESPFAEPSQAVKSVVGVVRALARAEDDPRVKGLYIRFGSAGLPLSQAAEYREAFERFKAKGKFIVAHTQSIFTQGLGDLYAVAGADEISMQPNGQIFSSGLITAPLFMRELLDDLGVTPEFRGYKEYKTAAHGFLYNDFTEPMREAQTRLVDSMFESVTAEIAGDREMERGTLTAMLADPPFIGQTAQQNGLIDALRFEIDAKEEAKTRAGEGAKVMGLGSYVKSAGIGFSKGGKTFALIQAAGPIMEGRSDGPFSDEQIGGDTVSAAVMSAVKDNSVKAIILRIDSPGGSAIASEQVRDALARAQAAGKPVVVSMAGVAASGGYWISMTADKIVAHSTTITGSIGVIGGKFVISELLQNIGVNAPVIATSEGVQTFSALRNFTEEDWARFDRSLRATYEEFTQKVAEGRGMDIAQVETIAKGRVWTGADAKANNLVDEIGGLRKAIDVTRAVTETPDGTTVRLKRFPAAPTLEQFIEDLMNNTGGVGVFASTLQTAAEMPAVRRMLTTLTMANQKGVMAYEPVEAAR